VEALLEQALRERRLVRFRLQGLPRVAAPHVLGRFGGVTHVLVFQVGGESRSGGLPNWRRAKLPEISELELLDERFEPQSMPAELRGWDTVLARTPCGSWGGRVGSQGDPTRQGRRAQRTR
jgi:hypothetical protein